ncbi:O-linked N-acetylglucosamine transferase, SPINDLY family protein, partial [Azospirillum isscasi]
RKGQGRFDDAIAAYGAAITLRPLNAQLHYNLGNLLRDVGRLKEAAACYTRAIALSPEMAEAGYNRANALKALDRGDEAIIAYRRTLILRPDHGRAYFNLGNLYRVRFRLHAAINCYERALGLIPDDPKIFSALTDTLRDRGYLEEAESVARTALNRWSDSADAHFDFGFVRQELNHFAEAEAAYIRALVLEPADAKLHVNLGTLRVRTARSREAIASFGRALTIDPTLSTAHWNILAALLYVSGDSEARFAEHRRHEDRYARPLYAQIRPHANVPDFHRRLRVGYMSSDFRQHPVGRNLLPLMREHDHGAFEIYGYSSVVNPDAMTAAFKAHCDQWRDIVSLNDRQAADRVREDGIDILVHLAGHFDANRPLVCAYKPAPVQVSFHDTATSGLEVVDYLISDRVLSPRPDPERFTERLVRLPSFYLADPIADAPPLVPPPMSGTGRVTFGCFNCPAKFAPEVLELWARLLRRLPDARLVLKYSNWFQDPGLRGRTIAAFAEHRIDPARLHFPEFAGITQSVFDHLAQYDAIDIALDPFPFCGATATYEALWMGVPVVTLPRDSMVSRWTASMATSLGLTELIAGSEDEYLDIAAGLAAAPERLAALRAGLRDRIAASPLCNSRLKVRHIERAYR